MDKWWWLMQTATTSATGCQPTDAQQDWIGLRSVLAKWQSQWSGFVPSLCCSWRGGSQSKSCQTWGLHHVAPLPPALWVKLEDPPTETGVFEVISWPWNAWAAMSVNKIAKCHHVPPTKTYTSNYRSRWQHRFCRNYLDIVWGDPPTWNMYEHVSSRMFVSKWAGENQSVSS